MNLKKLLFLITPFFVQSTTAQTFSTTVNESVPDDGSTNYYEVDVSGLPNAINGEFGLVQVCFNINHPYASDMTARLMSPDGTLFWLFYGIGGDQDNFENTCLRDDANMGINIASAPFSGTFKPMGDMGLVNSGQNPNGTWSLVLMDTYAFADQGYLIDWSITFDNDAPSPFPFVSSNLPIVKIFTGGYTIESEPKIEATMRIIDNGDGQLNYYTDTDFAYNGKIMVELQGFTGPWYPKKNYDFDLIDEEGLEIDSSLLGMPAENDWILKAEYLDPTLMYNSIAYEFSRRMGRYAPRTKFCEVFVDGEYTGLFTLTEKVKRDDNRVSIADLDLDDISGDSLTGGYIIEMNHNGAAGAWDSQYLPINYNTNGLPVQFKHVYPKAWEIMPEQFEYIKAYVDSFEWSMHQWNFDDPEFGFRKFISENSFIDFMLVNEMSTNYDSYGRSTFIYKEKITDGGKLKIGPPWDYDRGFCCVENWVWEETHPGWPFPDWWDTFHNDSLFLHNEWCRWNSLREDIWATDEFMTFIDSLNTLLSDAEERNHARWPEQGWGDFNGAVNDLQQRLTDRLNWMDANIIGSGQCVPELTNGSVNAEYFESDFVPNCWTMSDADGDGSNWQGGIPVNGFESEFCALSYSFGSPDNYLITPQLTPLADEHLTWRVAGIADESTEHYQVLLSTTGNAVADFETVLWEENYSGDHWSYRAADLSAWWGQEIYIAFRHFNSDEQYMLRVDDIRYPTWTNPTANCNVAIAEIATDPFVLFPNPASESVTIIWPLHVAPEKLIVLDAIGKVVAEIFVQNENILELDVTQFSPGTYVLKASMKNDSILFRPLIVK